MVTVAVLSAATCGNPLGGAEICLDDDAMTAHGTAWIRWILRALSLVLPVAVAVASNQILTEGRWSWWWTGIAVVLTVGSTLVTYRLTLPPANGPVPTVAIRPAPAGQVVDRSTAGKSIDQLDQITGNLRLRDSQVPVPSPAGLAQAAQAPEAEAVADDREPPPGLGGQWVGQSQVEGSITQVRGVVGDVNIERS